MNNDNSSIHEFQVQLICEYFSNFERQGPGSPDMTKRALSFIDNLTKDSRIADLGCGTGGQTMTLAQHTPGQITGLDLFPKFIDLFNKNAASLKLSDRVKGLVGSMEKLPFEKESLDMIWSEGAIYNIGFERGLTEWREYLKPGGYIAVSEASWFTEERPKEINDFWTEAYPGINTIPNHVMQLQKAGYLPVATFVLPDSCWTENFFAPQTPVQETFLKQYEGNETAKNFIAYMQREKELFDKYKAYYGYTFYIGKKI